jgi:hypothetical protein
MKEKKKLSWDSRKKELLNLLDAHRSKSGGLHWIKGCIGC